MKIIKSGTVKYIEMRIENYTGRYSCDGCGCIVELDEGDTVLTGQTFEDGPFKYILCPIPNCKGAFGQQTQLVIRGARKLLFERAGLG